jgi:hypothetical protein
MIGFIACSGFVYANSAPLRATGDTVVPVNDIPVRLESEQITIWLRSYEAEVACNFNLVNEGPSATYTVRTGFPAGDNENLENFRASNRKGKKYDVTTRTLDPRISYDGGMHSWKVFDVPFESTGKPEVLQNEYKVKVNSYGLNVLTDRYFRYILKTGAHWKGKIKKANVTVYLKGIPFDQITSISPAGYKVNETVITWEFKNFEPTQDIEIFIMNDVRYDRMVNARKILQKDPNNAHAHYMLGTAIFMKDSKKVGGEIIGTAESEKEFLKAIELDPHHLDAKWYLASLYFKRDEKPKALNLLREIAKEMPEYYCSDKLYNVYRGTDYKMLIGKVSSYIVQ